ncbi:MAG: superoxide dismutase [Phycisphaeraceae bacterium]
MAYELPPLPYGFDALEPAIDATTMQIHHDKHHNKYATGVSSALEGTEWADKPIDEVLRNLEKIPADKQTAVRNSGGGHYNHSLFWPTLTSPGKGGEPTGKLKDAIERDCGGMDGFKDAFTKAATGRFGSGWAWLCVDPSGKLHVTDTANQDNPIMPAAFGGEEGGHQPILGIDVWEHAYYLKYQNRRPDYVEAFFSIINWEQVGKNYEAATG